MQSQQLYFSYALTLKLHIDWFRWTQLLEGISVRLALRPGFNINKITNEAYCLDSRDCLEYKRAGATICACAVKNNGQKVDFAEIDAGGGPETRIQLGVALRIPMTQHFFSA